MEEDDPMVSCPIDSAHRLKRSRMPYHIIKCCKNDPRKNLSANKKRCAFNATHFVEKKDYEKHLEECPSAIEILDSFGNLDISGEENQAGRNVLPVNDESEDKWNTSNDGWGEGEWTKEATCSTYNPKEFIHNRAFGIAEIGLSKAEKKSHRTGERRRVNQLTNDFVEKKHYEKHLEKCPAATEMSNCARNLGEGGQVATNVLPVNNKFEDKPNASNNGGGKGEWTKVQKGQRKKHSTQERKRANEVTNDYIEKKYNEKRLEKCPAAIDMSNHVRNLGEGDQVGTNVLPVNDKFEAKSNASNDGLGEGEWTRVRKGQRNKRSTQENKRFTN